MAAVKSDKTEILIMNMDMISSICLFILFFENEIVNEIFGTRIKPFNFFNVKILAINPIITLLPAPVAALMNNL